MNTHPVILFDGICNFCDATINFTIRRDKAGRYRFAALQSEAGKALLNEYGMEQAPMNSFILIEDGKIYQRSTAALRVSRHLSGGWPLLYGCMIIPVFIRDAVYNWIARNRYKWFGKKDSCMLPGPELRARFL